MSISLRSHPILSSDAALGAYHTSRMEEARLIRAAQITLRREIFKHFAPRIGAAETAEVACRGSGGSRLENNRARNSVVRLAADATTLSAWTDRLRFRAGKPEAGSRSAC